MQQVVKAMDNKYDFRINMVRPSQQFGVSSASAVYMRSRKTVRKWRDRYAVEGLRGLFDRSRRPHSSPNKTSPQDRAKIIRLKQRTGFGAERLHSEFDIRQSARTIQKVCREAGLGRKRKSKRQNRRDLRAWKESNFAPLEYWQVDTKDCSDIPYYVEPLRYPKFFD